MIGINGQSAAPRSVVLVHGIFDTARIFSRMEQWLAAAGFRPLSLNLAPSDGSSGLPALAEQLASFVDERIPFDQPFDLIGFSMGGLVSRYYVQRLGGIGRVRRFITLSTPHYGSLVAYAKGNEGSRQMRPGSAFLHELNRDASMLGRLKFASIWTPFDLMIIPATSSCLGVGEEFRIPIAIHPWMLTSRRSLELITRLLNS